MGNPVVLQTFDVLGLFLFLFFQFIVANSELKTFELWISRSMFDILILSILGLI